ncbi:hypothetical protein CK203_111446 [Vitis vinifera]|uniref:Uncharacterized protein n=1 Tax=Vitis vinifera TaxID=29760 RepID=A0A438BP41_VITVI|nr:hypothetical protein CK203_111446 [Vitis vinifera]
MSLRKRPSFAKSFRNSFDSSAKIFAAAKPSLAHECHFADRTPISQLRNGCEAIKRENTRFRSQSSIPQGISSCETKFGTRVPFRSTVTSISKLRNGLEVAAKAFCCEIARNAIARLFISLPEPDDARTSGHLLGHHFRPNFDSPIWREQRSQIFLSFQPQTSPREAPVQGPTSEPPRPKLFPLRRSPHLKILRRGVISLEPSPPHLGAAPAPPAQPQELQPPLSEPQIPSGHLPIAAGACRFIPPMRRYHMEHLLAPRDFFYPSSHGFLSVHDYQAGASTNPHLLRGNFLQACFLLMHFASQHLSTPALDSEERSSFGGPVQDFEGYFFGPHHLIMAALLYFEEKVHKKKLQRADAIPLLFHCCARFWSIWGIHQILSWSANVFAERFTLDKWNNMTAYRVEQPGRPQPAEIPAARRASPRHIPEGIPIASPTISRAPPVTPASSEPSTSAEPRMAIPISEYRELCRSLQT